MAIKPWRDISLGKKRAFTRWKCVVLQCTVGITSQLQYEGMFHWNSILRRQFMFEHLAASKTVTARPNEQLIQNAINWPQEVKTAFPKWKKSVLNNISQAWTPKKGSVARMLTNVKKSCSQTCAASNWPPYHEASFLQACHPKMTLKHCLCSENGQFAYREK